MTEMIRERQASEKIERHDLFSQLLEANDNNLDATTLTESELIGDYFSSQNTRIRLVIEA
jgi:cytochrome P450